MSFASSAAAFGIKPATTSQPTTSLFGQPSQPQQQQQQSASNPFGTFGSQQPAQGQNQSQGTSLFGSTLGQQPQQQQQGQTLQVPSLFGGGAFGAQQSQPQQQQQQQGPTGQAPSLFSGGFGTQQSQPQQQQSSLFGQTGTNTQPQNSFGSSLFGNTQNQNPQQQQQQQGPSLFGSTNTGSTGFGNWGTNSQQQPGQTGGAFGSILGSSNAPSNTFLQKPAGQQFLSSTQGAPPFTKSTKFNDLPDNLKKTLEDVEAFIQGRIQISDDLKQRKLGEEALKGQEEVRAVHKDLMNAITTLQSDVHHTRDLKGRVDQTVQDTIVATRIVDGFRNPQQNGVHLKNHANFPLEFFNRVTEQMRGRLRWYKTTIEQIERKLSSAAAQTQHTPQAITSTLEAQHQTFIALASKTAALNAELQKIKTLYTQLWRTRTGSMRDPFNDLDRGSGADFGIESLSAK